MLRVGLVPNASMRVANGVNRYVTSLVEHLEESDGVQPVLVRDDRSSRRGAITEKVVRRMPVPKSVLGALDVVHVPLERIRHPVRFAGVPVVVTIHGLGGLSGEFTDERAEKADRLFVSRFERLEDVRVITPSRATRDHVCERLHVEPSTVEVIPFGVDSRVFHPRVTGDPRSQHAAPNRFDVRHPYVLSVGPFSIRKNSLRLLQAFRRLRDSARLPHKLVLAGRVDRDRAMAAALKLGVAEHVVVTGPVSDPELASLYRGAAAVCLVSRYEGFGLPALEAMACGAPLVISNAPALLEVAGPVATVVRREDGPEALSDALAGVLGSVELMGEMERRGLEHAARFTWADCADAHAQVYRNHVALSDAQRSRGTRPIGWR